MFVADIMAEESRHRTHSAGMGVRFVEGTIERHFTGIEADAGPGLTESSAQVFFAGHEIYGASLRFIRLDEIHQCVFRRFLPRLRDVIESFSGKVLELGILDRRNENTRGAAAIVEKIFPIGVIAGAIFLDSRANGVIFRS